MVITRIINIFLLIVIAEGKTKHALLVGEVSNGLAVV
jgi:hypothetical protein